MHVKSIHVRSFGTLDQLDVELEDGLNVINGPNEAGKSTLMRAAWLCLMWPCRSQSEAIRSIEPNQGGTPEVRVILEDDGTTYKMEKTFDGSSGSAHLRVRWPDGSVDDYTDDDAESRLRTAIGVGELGGRPKSPVHYGFWPAVWARQDERHLDPGKHLVEHGSRDSLSTVLAEISGDVLAGPGADVVDQAKDEYDRFYTSSGNFTSRSGAPLYKAQERLDELQEQFDQLQSTRQNYEDDLDELQNLKQEIGDIEEDVPELEVAAKKAAAEFERVETLQSKLEQENTRLETAETKVEQRDDRVDRRESLREEIRDLEEDIEEIVEDIEETQEVVDAHLETRDGLEEEKEDVQQERERLKRQERLLQAHLDVLNAEDRLEEIEDRADRYNKIVQERDELRTERESLSVTEEDVTQLEDQKSSWEEAKMRLDTAAARLSVEGSSDLDVRVGDAVVTLPAEEGEEFTIDSRTTVHVGADLRIRVEPGGKNLAQIRSDAETAADEYRDALGDLGVESVADARSQYQRIGQIDTRLENVEPEIQRLVPEGSDSLDEAQTGVEAQADKARERRAELADEGEIASLPGDEETVRDQLQEANTKHEAAQKSLAVAREALQEHDETMHTLREKLQGLRTEKKGKEESLENVNGELDQHVDEHGTDAEIEDALDKARRKRDDRKAEVDRIRDELDDLDAESITARKERTEQALENAKSEKSELQDNLNRVEGRLERDELHGLHDRLEEARQKREDAEAEVNRLTTQAKAAKLLYETLTEKRAQARRKYLAPLREKVEQLLGRFFDADESTVAFDENLALENISRSTDGRLEFDQLSAGAKQQLGLLIRLAMAQIVARERPHPVFLDDALSDTDPERFDILGDILHGVAQEMQIIMTTCHRGRHRKLGANSLRMEALKR